MARLVGELNVDTVAVDKDGKILQHHQLMGRDAYDQHPIKSITNLREELDANKGTVETLQKDLNTVRVEFVKEINEAKLETTKDINDAKIELTKYVNDTAVRLTNDLNDAKVLLTDEINRTETQLTDEINRTETQLTDEINKVKLGISDLVNGNLEDVKTTVESLSIEVAKNTKNIDTAIGEITLVKGGVSDLDSKLVETKETVNLLDRELNTTKDEITDVKSELGNKISVLSEVTPGALLVATEEGSLECCGIRPDELLSASAAEDIYATKESLQELDYSDDIDTLKSQSSTLKTDISRIESDLLNKVSLLKGNTSGALVVSSDDGSLKCCGIKPEDLLLSSEAGELYVTKKELEEFIPDPGTSSKISRYDGVLPAGELTHSIPLNGLTTYSVSTHDAVTGEVLLVDSEVSDDTLVLSIEEPYVNDITIFVIF